MKENQFLKSLGLIAAAERALKTAKRSPSPQLFQKLAASQLREAAQIVEAP